MNVHFVNAKGILSAKNGMNIYRGCTHGCIYCDSRYIIGMKLDILTAISPIDGRYRSKTECTGVAWTGS